MSKQYTLYQNQNGPDIGVHDFSGVGVVEQDGLYFKDHSRAGTLLPFMDWRLSHRERAEDLAKRLTVEQIAGLMLYSSHQSVPARPGGHFGGSYNGKDYSDDIPPESLTDQQKAFLREDHIRHVLLAGVEHPAAAAAWSNLLQAEAESLPMGIPVNICSDPRHGAEKMTAEFKGGGGSTSKWPEGIAMSATFDPETCLEFASIAAREYRAMGITTALSPQVDLATEPRWMRFGDTFGEDAQLAAAMGKAYCDGMQTTPGAVDGWGRESVCAMVKHWPGGASGEGGRDAHYAYGKYAVYPGNNFEEHLIPFIEGAFKLDGPTGCAASVMPYYSISWGQSPGGENVGNSYSSYLVTDLLRGKYDYDGVVCTDWGITGQYREDMTLMAKRCWGVEELTEPEQILLLLEAGVDQLGGNNELQPVLDAYALGCEKRSEAAMRSRMEQSAARLLVNSFRCGLFENPYLDPEESAAIVGCEAHKKAGLAAQLRSAVLLKNQNGVLPLKKGSKVYVPERHIESYRSFFGFPTEVQDFAPLPEELVNRYFTLVSTPEEADAAIVVVETPICDSYSEQDAADGGNGYLPISLQYRPYQADSAREQSIAAGDPGKGPVNRSYRGKTAVAANERDLDNVLETRKRLGSKPLVVVAELNKPTVLAELEPSADAILAEFGISPEAVLLLLTGEAAPTGRLPMQLPKDMETVETQKEDVPFDMEPYRDAAGNAYDFGFGLPRDGTVLPTK
ncbi:MAG: glycoside hydrolase family 3 N-terminal domain-containing protein [Oscillospiraceae bacterium]